jgi:hypothetical protein
MRTGRLARTLNSYIRIAAPPKVVIPMTLTARAQALFASCLQPSDRPTPAQVAGAIINSLHGNGGVAGCVATVATEYGDHPEAAAARMRWALALASASGVFADVAASTV